MVDLGGGGAAAYPEDVYVFAPVAAAAQYFAPGGLVETPGGVAICGVLV